MRILHVSTPSTWRGGEQQVAYLAIALKAFSEKQQILTPIQSVLSQQLMHSGIHLENFKRSGALDISLAKNITRICEKEKIQIIHTHDSHAHSAAVISAAIFGNKTPVVVSRRVDFAISSSPLSIWKYNHSSVKKIICVSEAIKDITAPRIKDKSKLVVVHSGIDLHRYENLPIENILRKEFKISEDKILIGNLSALADHKDYPTFIEVAAKLLHENLLLHFFIIGEGPERTKLENLIRSSQLQNNITLTGFRKDVPAVMSALDIFMITSKTEGLGTIVLEAFACKIPVVATKAGGIPELVIHEKTGLLAEPGDVDQLVNQVKHLIKNPRMKVELAENAANYVQQYSYENTAQKTFEIYKTLITYE
ncbi:glycosyltransferase [soil metagenome]